MSGSSAAPQAVSSDTGVPGKPTVNAGGVDDDVPQPIPNLELQQLHFVLTSPRTPGAKGREVSEALLKGIETDEMAPYLSALLAAGVILPSGAKDLHAQLHAKNEESLKAIDDALVRLEESEGDMEVNAVRRQRAAYLARIGDKTRALEAHKLAIEKAAGLGSKLDLVLTQIRIGLFHGDASITIESIAKAKELVEEGGDWDRRNRLKVYEGLHLLSTRQFKQGGELFLDALSTFTATELLSYKDFVTLTVIANVLTLGRRDIKKKIIDSPEVLQVIDEIEHLRSFSSSLYNCDYAAFFKALAEVEQTHLLPSRVLSPHARYYVREMRLVAYSSVLQSYSTITLPNMAAAFGVTPEFLDADLARFIASGRLPAVIDRVAGVVESKKAGGTSMLYSRVIKEGDLVLSATQRLSRDLGLA
ncbi:putative RPN7-subunit of the regulatory particle of the proteasome [Ceraceosorus guamensis]|uniref:Putative RPN7-subunit of the regulatory particle of the proteasome n=1 Tax=Ceraceosorus guamensis TaxID=1522189 RepID=A0A316W3S3_9BASI|nr:putative RPN7-subunit of the regulatory particle of the proteasome [Ceraceosorus guamensis]PWN44557.1 putative RPN7-subunit of the regulatory particle of the proteasome [Ceraceosorus guamensis]